MKFLRIKINGWTASFRYPTFMTGFQPTLPVPPLSTIYGLLSAVKGEIVTPKDTNIGFVFESEGKTTDLETIYELKGLTGNKTNVIKREILYNPELYLYLDNLNFKKYFKKPKYPVLLGRSSDLACINEIKEVTLEKKYNTKLGKTILPFNAKGAYGMIQSLPTYFSNELPRKALGTQPWILMNQFFEYPDKVYYDNELKWGIWIHKLNITY